MATATLIAPLAAGINGAASGTAEFYERGTTTPVNVYSNADATAVIGQSATLDANGGLEAYATVPLFIRVRSSAGAVVRQFTTVTGDSDVDVSSPSFTGLLPSGSQGAGGVVDLNSVLDKWFTSAGTTDFKILRTGQTTPQSMVSAFASVAASNQPFFIVTSYGAVGDGATINDAAFKAAHDAAVAAGGGIVVVPAGTYVLGLAFSITSQKVSMWGYGAKVSIISSGIAAGVAVTVNAGAATFGGAAIQDLAITAFSSGANVTPLQVVSTPGLLLRNVSISGFALAADIQSRVTLHGCDFTVPSSATAGDYVAKFTSNAADSVVLGGSFTQSRPTNTGGLSLGVNNILVLGAKVDISAITPGAGYGVDVGAANCKVESCDLITGVAATYAMRVNGDFSFTENDNSFAGSGRQCFLANALTATTRVWRGSRAGRTNTVTGIVTGAGVTVTLDADTETHFLQVDTSSGGGPHVTLQATPAANTTQQGARLHVYIKNNTVNSITLDLGAGFDAVVGFASLAGSAGKTAHFIFIYFGTTAAGTFHIFGYYAP
jgi:hypothetical protein